MKNLLRYFVFVLMIGGAYAQADLQTCPGSPKTIKNFLEIYNWSDCFGSIKFEYFVNKLDQKDGFKPDVAEYVGEFKDGLYHGKGTLSNLAFTYNGEFFKGYREGKGVLAYKNGSPDQDGIFLKNVYLYPSSIENLIASNQKANTQNDIVKTDLPDVAKSNQIFAQINNKRIALVVGNANYKTRPLRNPRNDADDLSNALKASGFQVIDLRDATLQQMRNGVRQFGDRLINNDVGLVYYSGHGVEVKGRNYFIPVNADIMREDEIADQGLDVSLILEKMNTAGKGVNILIVDACRDDPFGRSFRSTSRGLAQMDAPRGTIIAYATSPGKVASDGDGRNSPYTKNLVKAMQQPNKPIEQVFKEVRRAVQEETKNQQTPWENTSLSGDFYFKVQR